MKEQVSLPDLAAAINDEITVALQNELHDTGLEEQGKDRENIGSHICITVAGSDLAIPLEAVHEAGELQVVQPLPLLPDWLQGISNLRGEIVSVVNLGRFLASPDAVPGKDFLVVANETIKLAVTVDKITGTRTLFRRPGDRTARTGGLEAEFSAGSAVYDNQGLEIKIPVFDLEKFLGSGRLQNLDRV